jgi:hypothetical protein
MTEVFVSDAHALPSLILVFVTGIQCAASAARGTLLLAHESSHRADARWLDSCDKHRNEGGMGITSNTIRLTEAKESKQ